MKNTSTKRKTPSKPKYVAGGDCAPLPGSAWVDVQNAVPKDGDIVIVAARYLRADGALRNYMTGEAEWIEDRKEWHWRDGAGIAPNVYAWAPMPPAPEYPLRNVESSNGEKEARP